MPFPKNPKTIIIENEYYPNGLNELAIYKYYEKIKPLIIPQLIGREIIIFLATDKNKTTVIRNAKDKRLIYINLKNYDDIISGRTLSFHSSMKKIEKIGIVDIDIDIFNISKEATKNIYYYLLEANFIDNIKIRFTGKESFHLICEFKRRMYIDSIRELLKQYLIQNPFGYDVSSKRRKGIINLDLSPNKYKGGFITLYSLSTLGLKCMEIPINRLKNFDKRNAIV